jgi:hypothetical protein
VSATVDVVKRYVAARVERDRLKAERDGCFCERAEPALQPGYVMEIDGDDLPREAAPTQAEPCWKMARKRTQPTPYSDGGEFYLDPPMAEWCETCRRRQAASDAYKVAVRAHAGALRGLLRHGRKLMEAA